MTRRLIIGLAIVIVLGAAAYFMYNRTGMVPIRPAEFSELDPLVQQRLDDEIARANWRRHSPAAWLRLGMMFEANGLLGNAAGCYEHALSLRPDDARALHRLACVHERFGDLDRAVGLMERSAEHDPSNLGTWWRLLWWRTDLGDHDGAVEAYTAASAINATSPAVQLGAVRLDLAQHQPSRAIARLEDANLLEGTHAPFAHHLLAVARRQQGDRDAAGAAHAHSDGTRPRFSDPWTDEMQAMQTGYAAMRLVAGADVRAGRYADAERNLKTIIDHDPNDIRSLNMLAVCRIKRGDPAGAIPILRDALKLQPAHFGTAVNFARAVLDLPKDSVTPELRNEAFERLLDVTEARPDDANGWRMLAALAEARATVQPMIAALDRVAVLEPHASDVRLKAAYATLRLGHTNSALQRFRGIQHDFPDETEAWFGIVTTFAHAQRIADARAALEELARRPDADPQRLAQLRAAINR